MIIKYAAIPLTFDPGTLITLALGNFQANFGLSTPYCLS